MSDQEEPLPSFQKPPVVEVALSVQFDALKGLGTPQIGLLWQEFRSRLPVTEEQAPLEPQVERFGAARRPFLGVAFQMMSKPPAPRCWFLNTEGTELIQVQTDRFIHNWRKAGEGDQYPRYERLRKAFEEELGQFVKFIERENLGQFVPNQCEVSYVNHIVPGAVWKNHGDLDKAITVFQRHYSDNFLGAAEEANTNLQFVISGATGEPIGRLHVSASPVFGVKDDLPMLHLSLTARGRPEKEGIDGVMKFLDLGRNWVVRGFKSITTPEMHREWRIQNAG